MSYFTFVTESGLIDLDGVGTVGEIVSIVALAVDEDALEILAFFQRYWSGALFTGKDNGGFAAVFSTQ